LSRDVKSDKMPRLCKRDSHKAQPEADRVSKRFTETTTSRASLATHPPTTRRPTSANANARTDQFVTSHEIDGLQLVMQDWLSRSLRGENRSAAVPREKHASLRLSQSSHGEKVQRLVGCHPGSVGRIRRHWFLAASYMYIFCGLPLQLILSSIHSQSIHLSSLFFVCHSRSQAFAFDTYYYWSTIA
jgi:hypothetical protein